MDGENTRDLKKILRKEIKLRLTTFYENFSEKEKIKLRDSLCKKVTALKEYQNTALLLAYIPDKLEADCTPLILDALKKGKKVCVPKVDFAALKEGQSKMDFYFLDGKKKLEEQLESGAYGIREPKEGLEKLTWSARTSGTVFMIVPGVAFTKDGKRLGHGKGFYDIYIEEICKSAAIPFLCGVCLPCQMVEEIPTDAHDARMDCVIF